MANKNPDINTDIVASVMAALGRRGGKSRSAAKMAALEKNRRKAWAMRRKKLALAA